MSVLDTAKPDRGPKKVCQKCGPVRPFPNPRTENRCPKCLRPLQEVPGSVTRSLDFERDVTREAARGTIDPTPLIEYAEARAAAHHGYVNDTMQLSPGRDWLHEARAEIADGRNYLCWWLGENLQDPRQGDVMTALGWLALAFDGIAEPDV